MENTSLLHLLVVLLGFSYLICLNAVPTTRTRNMMLESQGYGGNSHMVLHNLDAPKLSENEKESLEAGRIIRRNVVQLNDYAPTGPNTRHTPPNPPKSP